MKGDDRMILSMILTVAGMVVGSITLGVQLFFPRVRSLYLTLAAIAMMVLPLGFQMVFSWKAARREQTQKK